MPDKYTAPSYSNEYESAYHCPHCGAFAAQRWSDTYFSRAGSPGFALLSSNIYGSVRCSMCSHCWNPAMWVGGSLIFPLQIQGPEPSEDMPDDVKADFTEARHIVQLSPRGAAALLRLALQKLIPHLKARGNDLNAQIGDLVKQGLNVEIQQALDTLRVVGNNAVHPGALDIRDDPKTVIALFETLNLIVEQRITQPKKVAALYGSLPPEASEAIERRDSKK